MKQKFFLLITAISFFLESSPRPAQANGCVLVLSVSNIAMSWDLNFNYQAMTFIVTKTSDPACDYGIGFSKGSASNYTRRMIGPNSVTLNYQLYKDTNLSLILKDASDITSNNDVILGHFDTGAQPAQQVNYYVQIPIALATAPAFKPYGYYSDTFNISAYEGTNPVLFATPITSVPVNIGVTVPKVVQLSLGNPGDGFDSNRTSNSVLFGSLTTGAVAQRDVLVRTNAGYAITLSSQNHGVLSASNPLISTKVPYTLMLNAAVVDLTSDQTPITISGQTSLAGDRYPVLIRIGDTSNSMAGSYSDTISISVTSTD